MPRRASSSSATRIVVARSRPCGVSVTFILWSERKIRDADTHASRETGGVIWRFAGYDLSAVGLLSPKLLRLSVIEWRLEVSSQVSKSRAPSQLLTDLASHRIRPS